MNAGHKTNGALPRARSLQWRIMLRQIPLLLILFLLLLFWLDSHLRQASYSTYEEFARHSSLLIASSIQSSMKSEEGHVAWEEIERMVPPVGDMRFEMVNTKGQVLYATEPEMRGVTHRLTGPSCTPCHVNGARQATSETAFIKGPQGASHKVFAAPLQNTEDCQPCHKDDGPKLGIVFVRQSLQPVQQLIRSTQIGLILAGVIAFVLTLLTTRLFLGRYLDQPLKRLIAGAKAIGSGDLKVRIDLPERSELAVLADAFNQSAEKLRKSIQEIQDQRDDLGAMYHIADHLSRAAQPDQRRLRAVELAETIFKAECALLSGSVNPESRNFRGNITYREGDQDIVDRPYSDDDLKSALPRYSSLLIESWRRGKYDGWTDHVRGGGTVAYPVEHNGKMMGIMLTTPREGEDDFAEGRAIGSNPDLVRAFCKHLAIALEFSQLQLEFVRQERLAAIGETVAGLAHCLKNTLNGLRGGQYVMESAMKNDDPQKLQQGWKLMQNGVRHIERLSLDMLYYAGERTLKLEMFNPNEIMAEVLELLKESAAGQGVGIRFEVDDRMPKIPMDRTAIYRAVLNLATNAIDACVESEKGNSVVLKSAHMPEEIVLTVADDGVGMSESTLTHIFERFFTTKSAKGTGLGLPVVHKIAEEHGGVLKVESKEGKGSTFSIILPQGKKETVPKQA